MRVREISIAAVICAAGSSSRMRGIKKEYLPLPPPSPSGKPVTVLGAAVSAFASSTQIGPIVVTVTPDSENGINAAKASLPEELRSNEQSGNPQQRIFFVPGGPTRRASVYNALKFLESHNPAYVLIHDGARPWIKGDLIEKIIKAAISYGAVIPALPLIETPKEFSGFPEPAAGPEVPALIKRHLRRTELCTAQTPQGFRFPEILTAHEKAREKEERENYEYTDDAEVWGEFIGQVAVIPGDPENRKITYPEDLVSTNTHTGT